MSDVPSQTTRSVRLRLRATKDQEVELHRATEQTLLDQRLFMVSGAQYQAFKDLLEQPEQPNRGLRELFSRKAPWVTQ
jgi:uncharacterized protein (DUF1778 family)